MNNPIKKVKPKKLEKKLKLFDVYAISTGAMFSSGFFLLPGIAAGSSGPSVILAYLVAGILILPAMFSMAELSTAMPKAGGAYYFLDRSLGPVVGTIGGVGSWFALVFKSSFALIGMGAYLAIYVDVPITPLAIFLTLVFGVINIVGAKESSGLQKILVTALVGILMFYIIQGLVEVLNVGYAAKSEQFTPFFAFGFQGFAATIGLVFVSYAGLTKVASVSEEVENPDRNIPLGMILSLLTATVIYVVGVYIMVFVLEPSQLRADKTPVATSGEVFLDWLPNNLGLLLIVIAAIAAFASTGNAGIMSASRYPLAMARDRLVPQAFERVSERFQTPVNAIYVTVGLMIVTLLVFNVEDVAKLASAFQLVIFGLVNLAVIVMRESKIEGYDPGYKSPLYPWVQILGLVISAFLIAEMGLLSIIFSLGIIIVSIFWFYFYAIDKVRREGAIYHVHARLGQRRDTDLDQELKGIVREKGLRDEDPFDEVAARAFVHNFKDEVSLETVIETACASLSNRVLYIQHELEEHYLEYFESKKIPIARGMAIPHLRLEKVDQPEMVLIRCDKPVIVESDHTSEDVNEIYGFVFFISDQDKPGQHLRMIGEIAEVIDMPDFPEQWMEASNHDKLRRLIIRDDRYVYLTLRSDLPTVDFIDKKVKQIELGDGVLLTIIQRDGDIIIPKGNTRLLEGDRLSMIGEAKQIDLLKEKYVRSQK
jgi:amino acid transporter/mannitol/fructose-specific phosphotransferase system IIA component (Ntr-type)